MLNQEIIEKMLSKFRSEELITIDNLIQYGLTKEGIEDAIKNNIIKEVSNGLYEFISIEDIYKHGLYQIQENDINRAKYCFKRCYELDNNHTKAIKELIYLYIKTNEYYELSKLLENLKINNTTINTEDINLYQYLFNISTQTIEKYHKNAKYISKEEILSPKENNEENKIRELIYEDKFLPAMKELNALNVQDKKFNTIERKILRALLSNAITESQTVNKKLIKLAKEERYHEISRYLRELSVYRNLKISDKYSLFLLKQIESILRNKEIPNTIYTEDTKNMFQAMDDYDFELAKELNLDYLTRYNISTENLLTILLTKINELINNLKEKQKDIVKNTSISKEKELTHEKNESNIPVEVSQESVKTTKLTDVIMTLLQGNIDEFTKVLKKYLDEAGYSKYEYLIMKLVKISLLNNDISFLKPITVLTKIDNSNYEFDPSIYIQEFYNTLSKDLLEETKIYLEILFVYYEKEGIVVNNLINTLNEAKSKKETLEKLTNKTISDKIDNLIEDKKINSISTMQEERELVKSKITELKSKGNIVGIIKNIPWERRKKIHTIAKEFDNLVTYGIGEEPKLIIFRLTDPNQERLVFKESLDDFFRGAKNKDYQYRIEIANKLLKDKRYEPSRHKDPRAFFAILGKLYLGTKDIENAITYLTIANEYNKTAPESLRKYDFEEILEELQNPTKFVQEEPKKENITKQEKNYTLSELQDIAYYIDEENITYEEAIIKYSLKEEHIILIKLIYARDFYIDGMYVSGDKLLKEAEKTKVKSEEIAAFIKEIKINKRFYRNQTDKHTKKRKLKK